MDTKVILDTNVPVKAATAPNMCPSDELSVQRKCMEYVNSLITGTTKLVLDVDYEIIREYRNNIDKSSNMGILFLKWLDQYLGKIDMDDLLKLKKDKSGEYESYPLDEETKDFDSSDKKFIALANLHPEKPPIIEGTDGKWWGYIAAFKKYGIRVYFLDEEYAQMVYQKKIVEKIHKDILRKDKSE